MSEPYATDQGAVFDLGYVPHDGPRLGRGAAIRATIRDGLRRVLGLRRRARKKVLPFLLIAISLLPAVGLVGFLFLSTTLTEADLTDTPFASHANYFDIVAGPVLIFSALAAPALLISDREDGVLAVYSSRPLSAYDYLLARGAALAIVVGGFMVLPQTLLYIGFSSLGGEGFAANLLEGGGDYLRSLAASVFYALAYGMPALLVATFARRIGVATGAYLGLMFGAGVFSRVLVDAGNDWAAWLAIGDHPHVVRDWLFGRTTPTLIPVDAGLDSWASLLVIVVITLATGLITDRRYRGLL